MGTAGKRNRDINDYAQSMLAYANLPKAYWAEAVVTAIHIQNRIPKSTMGQTPFYLWTGVVPDISYFRTFGCAAYSHIPKQLRSKWDSHTIKLRFVGYGETVQGYKLMHPHSHHVTVGMCLLMRLISCISPSLLDFRSLSRSQGRTCGNQTLWIVTHHHMLNQLLHHPRPPLCLLTLLKLLRLIKTHTNQHLRNHYLEGRNVVVLLFVTGRNASRFQSRLQSKAS